MDFERATVLLDFIEAASKHAVTYNVMVQEARDELAEMNAASKKKAEDAKKAKAEAEAEAQKAADDAKARDAAVPPKDEMAPSPEPITPRRLA